MTYRIRKNFREWEGTFSEKEMVSEISRGKLLGDDEFRAGDVGKWQKISTHPIFYDALLKRLFNTQYPIQSSTGSDDSPVSSEDGGEGKPDSEATRREKGTRTRRQGEGDKPESEVLDATSALDSQRQDGGTIHQAEIDELFSSAQIPKNESSVALVVAASPEDNAIPLPIGPIDQQIENPLLPPERSAVRPKPSKKLVVGSMIVLLLVLLFKFSGGEKTRLATTEKQSVIPELYVSLTDPKVRRETLLALVQQGDILYDLESPLFYLGAEEVYNQALALDESNCDVLGRLAESGARLFPESSSDEGIEGQVREFVTKGRAKEPHFAPFYRAEALLALYKNDTASAKELIANAKEVDPASLENLIVEGEVLLAMNETSAAEAMLQQVVTEDPYSIRAKNLLAETKLRKKEFTVVRDLSIAILKLNPIHAGAYYLLGSAAYDQDRIEEAERQYQTFVGLAKFASRSDLYRAYYRMGLIQENRKNRELAAENYRLAYYYMPEKKSELGDKLKGSDLGDASIGKLLQKNEYSSQYFKERADSLLQQKNYRHALIFLHASHLFSPEDGSALLKIGDVSEKLANNYIEFRAVTSYYERAIEKNPRLIQAYIKLGLLETDLYNLDRAFMLLKHAQTLGPNQVDPYIALGKYFYKARDYTASIEQFTKAFTINAADPEVLYYAGLLRPLGKAGGDKEATFFFYKAYSLNPSYYEAMIEWLKLKVKNYDKLFAIKFVRNLLDQDPGNANLYWALGEVYAANKEHRRAVEYFKKALELDQVMSPVRLSLAKSLEAVGELEKAVSEYRLVSRLDRRNGGGAYRAAEILLEARRFDLAEEVLNELVVISPNFPGAYRYLARIAQSKKNKDQAIAFMRKEVKNNPLNAKFRLEFASLLMDYQEYDLAITELTEVTNLSTKSAPEYEYDKIRAYLLLSRCYRAQSKMDSAEGAIVLALETDPNDPELHRELGYVYSGQQRSREAVKEFEFYLSRNPAAADSANIRTMIQNMVIEE